MSSMLEKANQFIQENRRKVYDEYRPVYHAVAPFGWINDPNGFCYIGEACHLFYQHNPYEAEWSDMHWGHWRSNDLVHWEDLPVIMAPDCDYDSAGCFSGSALPDGKGGAHIFYTGVHAAEDGLLQEQCLAFFNGEIIEKYLVILSFPALLYPM